MNRYEIIIFWSDGDVPELPGCMAHGATHEAALAEVRKAMALWIESARAEGEPVPLPTGQRLIFKRAPPCCSRTRRSR